MRRGVLRECFQRTVHVQVHTDGWIQADICVRHHTRHDSRSL